MGVSEAKGERCEEERRERRVNSVVRKEERRQRGGKIILSTGEGTISIFKLRSQVFLDGVARHGNSPAWGGKSPNRIGFHFCFGFGFVLFLDDSCDLVFVIIIIDCVVISPNVQEFPIEGRESMSLVLIHTVHTV